VVLSGVALVTTDLGSIARGLLLLITANSLPWLLGRLLGPRLRAPLDLGLTLADGRALFGTHKTWRGLVAASVGCAVVAELSGIEWRSGVAFGVLSLLGDALSSAVKRRLALEPGKEVPGLDQLPEALLPLITLREPLRMHWIDMATVCTVFLVLDLLTARLRHPTRRAEEHLDSA